MNKASPGQVPQLLVTRPAEEAGRTIAAAREAGFAALAAPLLRIVPRDWHVPQGSFDALLFTSGRAPGLAGERHPSLRTLPAWCVGANTASRAADAGFRIAGVGHGDGSAIVRAAAAQGVRRLLQPGGDARAPLHPPGDVEVVHVAIYAAEPVAGFPPGVIALLSEERLFATMLFSPRTACLFRDLVLRAGLSPGRLRVVALSDAVAAAAGSGWHAMAVAATPDIGAALAAATRLWQGAVHG